MLFEKIKYADVVVDTEKSIQPNCQVILLATRIHSLEREEKKLDTTNLIIMSRIYADILSLWNLILKYVVCRTVFSCRANSHTNSTLASAITCPLWILTVFTSTTFIVPPKNVVQKVSTILFFLVDVFVWDVGCVCVVFV